MNVIPAHPLALNAQRRLDERRQRALTRYYIDSGVHGLAVGVHTTQFAIREAGLYEPVLHLAMEEARGRNLITVAGVMGRTEQAVREAGIARDAGYKAALLGLGAMRRPRPCGVGRYPRVRFLPPACGRRAHAALRLLAAICGDTECGGHQDRSVQSVSDGRCRPCGL
jgi:hypothetical protein